MGKWILIGGEPDLLPQSQAAWAQESTGAKDNKLTPKEKEREGLACSQVLSFFS